MQPLLTASHLGWGLSSLDQDAAELSLLARYLAEELDSEVRVWWWWGVGRKGGRGDQHHRMHTRCTALASQGWGPAAPGRQLIFEQLT